MGICQVVSVGSYGTPGGISRAPVGSRGISHTRPWVPTDDRVGCRGSSLAPMGAAMGVGGRRKLRNVKKCRQFTNKYGRVPVSYILGTKEVQW